MSGLDHLETFFAAYKQYKEDTRYIAGWLAETSVTAGYNLESKQGKAQRSAKKKDGKRVKQPGRTSYVLRVSDFVPMAEAIAAAEEQVMVPVALTKLFNRAIQTRRRVTNWFTNRENSDEQSNQRHSYFITVLEDAFKVLRPYISSGPQLARTQAQADSSTTLPLENLFAHLTIEEAADIADESEFIEATLPDVARVTLEQDEGELEEELRLAVSLLLQELETMAKVVRANWQRYKEGKIDLIVAAMVTDTAIQLAQKAEAEFDLVVPRPAKYPTSNFPAWKLLGEFRDTKSPQSLPEDSQPGASQLPLDTTFWPTYFGLRLYLDKCIKTKAKSNIPAIVPKDVGDVHEHMLRTLEFVQLVKIITFADQPRFWDAATREVINLFDHKSLYVATVFAVQMLLDSQKVLGNKCGDPSFELTLQLGALIRRFNQAATAKERFLPADIKADAYTDHSGFYNSLTDVENWVLDKGFEVQWTKLTRISQVASHPLLKKLRTNEDYKNYVLVKNPLLCGMMKYDVYLRYHVAGLRHEHQSLSICMMSHLYIAGRLMRQTKLQRNDPVWPDMEQVIYSQDPEWLFVGGLPKSLEEAKNKFYIVCGSLPTNRARDIPIRNVKMNVHKLRDFRETCVFGEDVYLPDGVDKVRTDVLIKRLLEAMRGVYPRGRLAKYSVSAQNPEAMLLTQKSIRDKVLTPESLLGDFAIWLQADMVDLFFDWYQMNSVCNAIWSSIFKEVGRHPDFDSDAITRLQPAMNPTMEILICDPNFPRFLSTAYSEILDTVDAETEDDHNKAEGDRCTVSIIEYHREAGKVFTIPGPLHTSNLYRNWVERTWKPRWDGLLRPDTAEDPRKEDLRRMVFDCMFQQLDTAENGGVTAAKFMRQHTGDTVAPYLNHMLNAMEKFSHVPEQFTKDRAVKLHYY